eukprot:369123-Amorphochlora_amoeboformis.AAC.1
MRIEREERGEIGNRDRNNIRGKRREGEETLGNRKEGCDPRERERAGKREFDLQACDGDSVAFGFMKYL